MCVVLCVLYLYLSTLVFFQPRLLIQSTLAQFSNSFSSFLALWAATILLLPSRLDKYHICIYILTVCFVEMTSGNGRMYFMRSPKHMTRDKTRSVSVWRTLNYCGILAAPFCTTIKRSVFFFISENFRTCYLFK